MSGGVEAQRGGGRDPVVEATVDEQQRPRSERGDVACRLQRGEGGGAEAGGQMAQRCRLQRQNAGEQRPQGAAAVEQGDGVDAAIAPGGGGKGDTKAYTDEDGPGGVHPRFGLEPRQRAAEVAGQRQGRASQRRQATEPRAGMADGGNRRRVLERQHHGVDGAGQESGGSRTGLATGNDQHRGHAARRGAVGATQVGGQAGAVGRAQIPAEQGVDGVDAQAGDAVAHQGGGLGQGGTADQRDGEAGAQAEVPPPRVLLVQPAQWPRALLRAELEEAGLDAVGAPSLVAALDVEPVEPERGPVRAILVDQDALSDPLWRTWIHALRARHPNARVLLLARRLPPPPPGPWDAVLRRPVAVGELAAALRHAVGR